MKALARGRERLTRDRRNRKLKDLAHSLCFIGPSVLGVLIFFVLPFCVVVYYSVIRNSINPEFVFLDNFIALFKNSAFRDAAKNTATFSALAVPLATVLALGLATREELDTIASYAFKVNEVLKNYLLGLDIELVDFKLEFGKLSDGTIVLADEISPDTCRFWDVHTHEKLDKDRFRRNLGGEVEAYQEIMRRLMGE